MKPVYLKFCGINSFSEEAEIDFEKLLRFGIFGIFGDTGSGKSTILDCIVFALYGKITRFGSREATIVNLINNRLNKASVLFEFEIFYDGRRRTYRVERELKRKNAVHTAKLYERCGDSYAAIAEGAKDCTASLIRIIGLDQTDFERCIALPQGEFAQFVKAGRTERLQLVSRLFDLTRYGDGLVKRINARHSQALSDLKVLEARLEPFEGVTEESVAELGRVVSLLKEREDRLRSDLAAARERVRAAEAEAQRKREADAVSAKLGALNAQREEIGVLERSLKRLSSAQTAVSAEKERLEAERELKETESRFSEAELAHEGAQKALGALRNTDGDRLDSAISELTERRVRAEASAKVAGEIADLQRKLARTREEYRAEAELFKDFRYEERKEELTRALGAELDFSSFAEEYGKAELLRGEYEIFAEELRGLAEKYPEIAPDARRLIEKYSFLSEGEKRSYAEIKAAYETRRKEREKANRELIELEKTNGKYAAHRERLQQLQTEGVRLKESLASAQERMTETEPLPEIEKRLAALKNEKRERERSNELALAKASAAASELAAWTERRTAALRRADECRERVKQALAAGNFPSPAEAAELHAKFGDEREAEARVERFRNEFAALTARREELFALGFREGAEEELNASREALKTCEAETDALARDAAVKTDALARKRDELAKKNALETELVGARKREALYERLRKLFESNKFMEFIAEEYLRRIARNASGRLLKLTEGRYFLRHDGNFLVGDNFNGGETRRVFTLSGGETFLVSLSLALALGEEICARSMRPIEFFFLDEGFGTLDSGLIDTVMDSLEKLKGEHFSIGIISHVEELKHRIESKLYVRKATEKRGSQICAE